MPFCCVRTLRPTWMVPGDPSVRTPPLSFRWRATFQGCRLGFVPSPDIRDLIGTMAVSPASGQLVTPTCQQIAAWVVPSGPLRPDLPIWSIALSRCEYLFVGMRATAILFTLQTSTTLNTTLPCSEKHPEIKALLGGSESPLPGQPLADPATSLWSWQSSVKAHPHPKLPAAVLGNSGCNVLCIARHVQERSLQEWPGSGPAPRFGTGPFPSGHRWRGQVKRPLEKGQRTLQFRSATNRGTPYGRRFKRQIAPYGAGPELQRAW